MDNNTFVPADEPNDNLHLACFSYHSSSSMTLEELFSGYDKLEAITYSSGLTFMSSVLERFRKATVILESDHTISMELSQILAFQTVTLKEEKIRFRLAKSKMSHEKLYILTNTGEKEKHGNLRLRKLLPEGFFNQRELICFIDNEQRWGTSISGQSSR